MNQKHDEQLTTLRKELEKLQKSHEEALDILREENDCIREQIDEKRLELEKANHESVKLKEDYETKEIKLKEEVCILFYFVLLFYFNLILFDFVPNAEYGPTENVHLKTCLNESVQ